MRKRKNNCKNNLERDRNSKQKQLKREAYEAMERQKKMMAEETDKAIKGTKVLSVDRTNHNEIDLN